MNGPTGQSLWLQCELACAATAQKTDQVTIACPDGRRRVKEAKAKAIPSDDGLGLEEQQGMLPVWPEAQEANPKQSVGGTEFGFPCPAFEHGELMSER